MRISATVNGETVHADDVWPGESLLYVLRERLGLPGSKNACEQGECGSCTIYLDGEAVCACLVAAGQAQGRDIVTVEGLAAADGTLHPVQQGVIDEQGFQCAFCMSGFLMATVGYLKTNPNPTRAELAHGISGNLCRCQDYDKILTAMMRGAENMRKA